MLYGKINQDFIQSRGTFGKNTVVSVFLYNNATMRPFDITDVVYEIKSVKYELNSFATCEIILQDNTEKKVNLLYNFNNGNIITIYMKNIMESVFDFTGRVVEFKIIDAEHDIYSLKLFSEWNYFNITPGKVRIGISGNNTVSETLEKFLDYTPSQKNLTNPTNSSKLFPTLLNDTTFHVTKTDEHEKIENFVVPNWTLQETIEYLIQFCKTKDGSGFIWYEDTFGLEIISVDEFLTNMKETNTNFYFNQIQAMSSTTEDDNTKPRSTEQGVKTKIYQNVIYDYEVVSGYDSVKINENIYSGSNHVMFDYSTKQIQNASLNFSDYFKNNTSISRASLLGDDVMNHCKPKTSYIHNEFNNIQFAKNVETNRITKGLFDNFKIKIKTNFNPMLTIGNYVTIKIPTLIDNVNDLSGKWIIVGVEHKYEVSSVYDNQPLFTSIFTISRDSKNKNEITDALNNNVSKDSKVVFNE
jgi:hypothetical protein